MKNDLEKSLGMMISSAYEHEHTRYIVSVAIGEQTSEGNHDFDINIVHHLDTLERVSKLGVNKFVLTQILAFQNRYGALPAFVLICDVNNRRKEDVVNIVMDAAREYAHLNTPIEIGDVEIWHQFLMPK